MTIGELNALPPADFVHLIGPVFEHSPWIAERVAAQRPFKSGEELHRALLGAVARAPREQQIALILAHPDLSARMSRPPNLSAHSHSEQSAAGLDTLTPEEAEGLERLNKHYRERFGFPFVICVRKHDNASIMLALEDRIMNDREAEIDAALYEIGEIARIRLGELLR